MHPRGIGHIFIHNLGEAEGGSLAVHIKRIAQMCRKRGCARRRLQRDAPACKLVRIQPPQDQIGIGHRRAGATTAIAGRARLGTGAFWPNPDLPQAVDMGQRATTGADLNHINYGN